MAPVHFALTADLLKSFRKTRVLGSVKCFTALTAGILLMHYYRKIIEVHWSPKYLTVPLYFYSWFSIFSILAKFQKKLWVLVQFLACGCSNSCSIDRANKRRDFVSSFCSDAYGGYLNFSIRRETIYQGSNPCSIGVIFEILFRLTNVEIL